ncbi:hypothetical protein [Stieleria marina]|uniref:Sialate O-acetylesterase domain-containing protein n=1 Tax=Stieleria marina TaxID=1930275 RepID=A0A517NME4_9BACT|nr:hypothetical protein K239x_02350 [Planctomycetes bacterium K23_9]
MISLIPFPNLLETAMKILSAITFAACLVVSPNLMADLRVPHFFSDHMVLQRDGDAQLWGNASPNANVSIEFGEKDFSVQADAAGKWKTGIAAGPANSQGRVLKISSGGQTIEIKDVLVGEVWLASGQSNMAFTLGRVPEYAKMLQTIDLPGVRMFCAAPTAAAEPQDNIVGDWLLPNTQAGNSMSAVAFFFAKKLHEELGVPVGIIKTAWGGKPVETLTSRAALSALPETKVLVDRLMKQQKAFDPVAAKKSYDQRLKFFKVASKQWQEKGKASGKRRPKAPARPKWPTMTEGNPGVLYDGMIHPFVGYTIQGAIWYQGEANAKAGKVPYDVTLPLMIRDWRDRWGTDFAFEFVQLANFKKVETEPGNNDPWPLLQDRMRLILETTPNTGMAVINDVGAANDIHPQDKKTPGDRLAIWALAKTYGQDIVYSGPLFASSNQADGAIKVEFTAVGDGLKSRDGGSLNRFEIAGSDKVWHWADAKISGKSTVTVSSKKVADPAAVRYAWAANPEGVNLVNSDGLPTSVFRTDDWDDVGSAEASRRTVPARRAQ